MYTYKFSYIYNEDTDYYPTLKMKYWDTPEEAFKAMEEQAKVNCTDSNYYYDIQIPSKKIGIFNIDDDSLCMFLSIIKIPTIWSYEEKGKKE